MLAGVFRILVWLIVLGLLLYSVFWVLDRRARLMERYRTGRDRRTTQERSGPVGPDDDEEFLRELDRRRRGD